MSKRNRKRNLPQGPIARAARPPAAVMQQSVIQYSSGPMPQPEVMAKYDQIVPGSAKKLFELFELQAKHRMNLEAKVIESNIRQERAGTRFGALLSAGALAAGTVMACFGIDIVGVIVAVSGLGSLVAVFILGKRSAQKELQGKR